LIDKAGDGSVFRTHHLFNPSPLHIIITIIIYLIITIIIYLIIIIIFIIFQFQIDNSI